MYFKLRSEFNLLLLAKFDFPVAKSSNNKHLLDFNKQVRGTFKNVFYVLGIR